MISNVYKLVNGSVVTSDVTISEFKTAAQANAAVCSGFITVLQDNTTKIFDDSSLQSFTVKKFGCASGQFTIGSITSTELDITMLTNSLTYGRYDRLEVVPYIGYLCTHSGTQEMAYIKLGKFFVDGSQVKRNGLFTDLVAYDVLMNDEFNIKASELSYTEGQTTHYFLREFDETDTPYNNLILFESCMGSNFDIDYSQVPLSGGTMIIDIEGSTTPMIMSEDFSAREVLSRLLVACGCNAFVSDLGKIKLVYPCQSNTTIVTLDGSDYTSIGIDPLDSTLISYMYAEVANGSETTEVVSPTVHSGGIALGLDSTYLTTAANALQGIQQRLFYNMVSGSISYLGYSIDLFNVPFIEPFDGLSVDSLNDATYNLMPLAVTVTYNGGVKVNISSTTLDTDTESTSTVQMIQAASSKLQSEITSVGHKATQHYALCGSSSGDTVKVVSIDNYSLYTGATLSVKFSYTNTADAPSMQISGQSNKYPILADGKPLNASSSIFTWSAGQIVDFIFDGVSWNIVGSNIARYFEIVNNKLVIATDPTLEGFHVDIGADSMTFNQGNQSHLKIATNKIEIGTTNSEGTLMGVTITDAGVFIYNEDFSSSFNNNGELNTTTANVREVSFNHGTGDSVLSILKRSNGHLSLKVSQL